MPMNKRLVIGNWKMNPATSAEARRIAARTRRAVAGLARTDVVACPPFVYLPIVSSRRPALNFSLGAQSVSDKESRAYTGHVSADMLKDLGVEYVIAGHSEQRNLGDPDAVGAGRIMRIVEVGLKAVVCVGENTRDDNGAYLAGLKEQLKNSLLGLPRERAKNIIIAYEPVWAVGASQAMAPEQIYEMSIFIKKVFADIFGLEPAMKAKVLYGGSVNSRNAADIISIGKVDGLLVGRESVNLPGFVELLRAVDKID